jgi:enamine deaminase RidA (YjgF/YER057c/UK114 family)
MSRQLISFGSPSEKVAGYSRAVVEGDWIFVSGTVGYDYAAQRTPVDVAEQTHLAFRNIEAALMKAGSSLKDIVRVRYYLTDPGHWDQLCPIFGQYLGDIRPASTAIVCALPDPEMKIEIEVTAKRA